MRLALALSLVLCACPSSRDGAGGGAPQGTAPASSPAPAFPQLGASAAVVPSAAPQPEADKIVPLLAGESLSPDSQIDGDVPGVELLFELRLLNTKPGVVGIVRAAIAGARARVRFGAHAFALDDGYEVRGDRHRGGLVLVLPGNVYRIVPSGALRALLNERRLDVIPFAATRVEPLESRTHLGRTTTRTRVTTAWGTLDLDQITPASAKPIARGDARGETGESTESINGGETLCRALLELIAADRSLGGAPCASGMIPVRAQVGFATAGGFILEATSLREGTLARADVAFPPPGTHLSLAALPEAKPGFLSNDALLALRAKGEPASLELSNKTPAPKVLLIDGAPIGMVTGDRSIPLRASRYTVEWRTPLGEAIEKPTEVDVPGKAVVAQWVPAPLSSASPIASARNGP